MSALCHWTQIIRYCIWDYMCLSTNLCYPIRFQVICIDILMAHDIWPFHLNWLKCQHATTWARFVNNYRKRLNTKFPVLCCSTLIDRLSISELTAVLVGCLQGNTVGPTSYSDSIQALVHFYSTKIILFDCWIWSLTHGGFLKHLGWRFHPNP